MMGNQISNWFKKGGWLGVGAMVMMVVISCSDDLDSNSQKVSPEVSTLSNAEMVLAAQEVMDITGAGMSSSGITYGRAAAHEGSDEMDGRRLCGAKITKSFSLDNSMPDSLIVSGSITIDFGDGTKCPDSANRQRSGKITTEFNINVNIKNHLYTSSETVTLVDFQRGKKTLSGVFHAQAASGGMRWLEITDAKLTHTPDDTNSAPTTITWSGSLTFTYDNNGTLTHSDDTKTITGTLAASSESGSFESEIVEAITFKNECFLGRNIPTSGIINITSAGALTVVDFGDGTCDKVYTSTSAGETTEMHL